jgi:hypothetical protein
MQRPRGAPERAPQPRKSRIIAVVTLDVLKPGREPLECSGIESVVLLDAFPRTRAKPIDSPMGSADADDRHIKPPSPRQSLKSRKDLLVGEIAAGAEEYKRV